MNIFVQEKLSYYIIENHSQKMSILERQESYFFNSDVSAGAVKVGTLGNNFTVVLDNPITVPKNALYATLEVVNASIWNSSPNISEQNKNNMFYITIEGKLEEITIPDGLYGVGELESFLIQTLANRGVTIAPFAFSENDSTQKIVIIFYFDNISIDFTRPNSCREVLGFDARVVTSPGENLNEPADTEAGFNRVVHYYIKSNVLRSGIPQNTRSNGLIAGIPISVKVGSLINYLPTNPLRCNADELIGVSKQVLQFTLLDQLERDVSTGGEEWNLSVVLRYWTYESGKKINHSGLGAHGNLNQMG